MSNSTMTTKVAYLLAGMGIGGAVALLLAPKSGKQTRRYLADKAEDGKDYVASKERELRRQAEDFVDKGKEVVVRQKERLADVLDAGRQVARNTFAR